MIGYLRSAARGAWSASILRENDAMRSLARSLGFVADAAASDAEALGVVLELSTAAG